MEKRGNKHCQLLNCQELGSVAAALHSELSTSLVPATSTYICRGMHREMKKEGQEHYNYRKGLWTEEEDRVLSEYIRVHGGGHWNRIPEITGLRRCGKSCRLRWLNYLNPSVKRGDFSEEEDDLIIRLHKLLGNRWSLIAGRVPGRTDNQVKNHWNTRLSRSLGIKTKTRPKVKKPTTDSTCSSRHQLPDCTYELPSISTTLCDQDNDNNLERSREVGVNGNADGEGESCYDPDSHLLCANRHFDLGFFEFLDSFAFDIISRN